MVQEWMIDYNHHRPHEALDNLSPIQFLKRHNHNQILSALVEAILKNVGLCEEAYKLNSTLYPISIYKINISKEILPNKD